MSFLSNLFKNLFKKNQPQQQPVVQPPVTPVQPSPPTPVLTQPSNPPQPVVYQPVTPVVTPTVPTPPTVQPIVEPVITQPTPPKPFKDSAYLYPGDEGYPTGGPTAAMGLPFLKPVAVEHPTTGAHLTQAQPSLEQYRHVYNDYVVRGGLSRESQAEYAAAVPANLYAYVLNYFGSNGGGYDPDKGSV